MARLGIDFGTTNTVAAVHDRGVISVVLHEALTAVGTVVQEVFPSSMLVDRSSGQRWFGVDAERRQEQAGGASTLTFVCSLKRQLRDYAEGRALDETAGGNGGPSLEIAGLLTGFLEALGASIRTALALPDSEPLETVITWPANANGAQRYATRKAFTAAGFDVRGSLNEPTASAIELADGLLAAPGRRARPSAVAVFDLGGGTFDASLVCIDGHDFRVLSSAGIEHLGGDDFDAVLLDLLLEKLGADPAESAPVTRHALRRHARAQKESISTGAIRSLYLNPMDFGLAGRPVSVPVAAFTERLRPMLAPAIETLGEVVATAAASRPALEDGPELTIYLVGGSARLPLVAEMVREAFPRSRVMLSDKPFRSVAMGAAISGTERITFRDVFARHFGLIRLADHGQSEHFDTIFPAGTRVPRRGEPPLEKVTWYRPAHNIGHLRYFECTAIGADGMPAGAVRAWSDIVFPYEPDEPLSAPRRPEEIAPRDPDQQAQVCEVYRCDHDGVITVELRRPVCDDARHYEICCD